MHVLLRSVTSIWICTYVIRTIGWTTKGSESESWWDQEFSLLHIIQTSSGPTQPPIKLVPGTISLGVNWPGHEADYSPRSSAKVKQMWIYISTSLYTFLA
jgi:hypothetical protein